MKVYENMRYAKDECYTTLAEAEKLVTYIKQNNLIDKSSIIWLPFDNELSNIFKALAGAGFNIILSSLEIGLDFYFFKPKTFDIVITNPPFSKRTQLLRRLLSFKKPFIILQATQFFNNKIAVKFLCKFNNDFKFILPQNRMKFLYYDKKADKVQSGKTRIAFYSFWLCYKINLKNTFNALADSGKESLTEEYDVSGNVIVDNQLNLFYLLEKTKT